MKEYCSKIVRVIITFITQDIIDKNISTKHKFAIVVNKNNTNNELVIFVLESYKNAIQDSTWNIFWKNII